MARPAVLTAADTIAGSFLLAAEIRGDEPAIREKTFGIWQPTSWRQWLLISKDIAYGLHAIGFRPGDVASIVANAVPEWVFADMGILCAGGISSGIYPTDSAAQVEYLVNDSRTRVIFVEDDDFYRLAVEADGITSADVGPGDQIELIPRPGAARVVRLGRTTFYQRARRKLRLTDSAEIPATFGDGEEMARHAAAIRDLPARPPRQRAAFAPVADR